MADGTIAVNGDEVLKILWIATVLAFMIERALAVIFEHRLWFTARDRFHLKGFKEVIAILLAYGLCAWSKFDILALMFHKDSGQLSLILTALIVAGGSKGAIKLMQDFLGVKRTMEGAAKSKTGKT